MKAVPSANIAEVLDWIIDKIKKDKKTTINEAARQIQINQFESLRFILLDFEIEVADQTITNTESKLKY